MSTAVDGFEILETIGRNANLFKSLRTEVNKSASALIKKYLKSKDMNLSGFQTLSTTLKSDALPLIIDSLTETELKSLTKKIDPHFPDLSNANGPRFRSHLRDLATASVEPALKPVKAKKTPSAKAALTDKKPKAPPKAQWPASMSAKPSRLRG